MLNNIILSQQLKLANTLGEGIIWDHRSALLYWTDIHQRRLYRATLDGKVSHVNCPEKLCSFGLSLDPNWLICAFASGFAWFHPATQQTRWIVKSPLSLPNVRMNDGRVDRQGRFWAGSMVEPPVDGHLAGALYRLSEDGTLSTQIHHIEIANSLCWSPDSHQMYFADSPRREIQVADFNPQTGDVGELRHFVTTDSGAYPDGACIDSEGCLWSAQWGSYSVKRYSPAGELLLDLALPCRQPSCVTFAGPDLNYLCVTSATQGLSDDSLTEHDGALYIFKTPFRGLAEALCTLDSPKP